MKLLWAIFWQFVKVESAGESGWLPSSPKKISNMKNMPIMIKWRDFQPMQWRNPYEGDCFSNVESILLHRPKILPIRKITFAQIFNE